MCALVPNWRKVDLVASVVLSHGVPVTTRSIFLLLLLCSSVEGSEIHQWRDANGNLSFGDAPPENAQSQRVEVIPNVYTPVTTPQTASASSTVEKAKPTVTMYTAAWCGVCDRARQHFQANGIPFKEYDIETTRKGEQDYERLGRGGVPLILLGKVRMQGFYPERFQRMYDQQ